MTDYVAVQHGYQQPVVLAVISLCLALMWGIPVSSPEARETGAILPLAIASGLLLALLFATLRIEVAADGVTMRMMRVFRRHWEFDQVASAEARDYRPMRQFGGWGWRLGRNGTRQYAFVGSRACVLTLPDGREVYLGANDPDGLAAAIAPRLIRRARKPKNRD